MNEKETLKRLSLVRDEIASLPPGYLSKKIIKGKERFYLQWSEDGKKKSAYVPASLVEEYRVKIAERKKLQAEEKSLSLGLKRKKEPSEGFATTVLLGESLRDYAYSVHSFKRRELYNGLFAFLHGNTTDKVGVLYGLRRTGKTVLMRQLILNMSDEELAKTAFLKIDSLSVMKDVNHDLKILYEKGYVYVFLDEVTLMKDFIDGASLFSDVYSPLGMKIVLSGTDSLSFYFAQGEELFDRALFFPSTFIPYREFERVLGVKGIDEYIAYGGTMTVSGATYNQTSPFADEISAKAYLNSSIARNITHSLAHYQGGEHFRSLSDLYQNDELVSAINRVVEDMNHRFTLEVVKRDFASSDLALSARNLRNDRKDPSDVLDRIDEAGFTSRLKELLEILDERERSVPLEENVGTEIREYLSALGLIQEIEVAFLPAGGKRRYRVLFAQPGLRYAQAEAFVKSLFGDPLFLSLKEGERGSLVERVLSQIKGRMMEEIVLLETKMASPRKNVFQLQFASGEFDMVVADARAHVCEIYEVKHSKETAKEQYRHLIDEKKLESTAWVYGKIVRRGVIYRGESHALANGIEYINVEEYLKGLGEKA